MEQQTFRPDAPGRYQMRDDRIAVVRYQTPSGFWIGYVEGDTIRRTWRKDGTFVSFNDKFGMNDLIGKVDA